MSVETAFAERLGVAAPVALSQLAAWKARPEWASLIDEMVHTERYDELADAFSRVLPFGTGGRRGSVGVGPNRFNSFTLGTSVQGHCDFLKGAFDAPVVVITYDVRRFDDARGRYPSNIDGVHPLLGVSSRDFAELAARIYVANGVGVWLQRRSDPTFLSTPELSFLIRELGAAGGLNVSASHNPPDDNGGKFYDRQGGQLVPPADQQLLDRVIDLETYKAVSWSEAEPHLEWLEAAHHDAWVKTVASTCPDVQTLPVAVTNLHGAGRVGDVLAAAGFPVTSIEEQATPDGAFPTVPGAVANPERPEVFALGLKHLTNERLLFATDPDADRIGVMVRHGEGWTFLSGNQIAAVVIDAVLRHRVGQPSLVVHTEVSSSFLTRVAELHGATVRNDLLVGFKYIADVMNHTEPSRFAVGAEESHGLLVGERMRDKCAGSGALWLAIAAADASTDGKTLVDVLFDLESRVGVVVNEQISKRFEGVQGRADMAARLAFLRKSPPTSVGGFDVTSFTDHLDESGHYGPIRSDTDAASRNVLVLGLAAGRLIFRPSGTEPKLKVYVEATGATAYDAQAVRDRLVDGVSKLLDPRANR